MRLLVAETPQRRHLREPRQAGIFGHDDLRFARATRNMSRACPAPEGTNLLSVPVKSNVPNGWWMNIAQPAVPMIHGMGTRAAVGRQMVGALAATHGVGRPAAVKLRPPFSKSEQWGVAGLKPNDAACLLNSQTLDGFTLRGRDGEGQRIRRNHDAQIAAAGRSRRRTAAQCQRGRTP